MRRITATWLATAATTIGLAAVIAALVTQRFVVPAVMLCIVLLFVAATSLSRAAQVAERLRELHGDAVDIEAWGSPLPLAAGRALRLESSRAFGAGLHLWVRAAPDRRLTHLKVAQPGALRHQPDGIEIADAAYVQWAGARIPRVPGAPALTVHRAEPRDGRRRPAEETPSR
ncbi:MAG TPA: hypothetical protein VF100_01725 [Thermoanaerobaculia bacterium]